MTEEARTPEQEVAFTKEHRERLAPVLAQLDAAGHSTFLDLCELLLMFSEKMSYGMLKWNHPRVLVHIKFPPRAKKVKVEAPEKASTKKATSKRATPKKTTPKRATSKKETPKKAARV